MFVNGDKLRGISQYNHYCYFPFLNSLGDVILKSCLSKFGEIRKPLSEAGYNDYIVDFAMVPKKQSFSERKQGNLEWECIVIELNPFETSTGAGLFSWSKDRDLLAGKASESSEKKGIPLRLHEQRVPGIERFFDGILLPAIVGSENRPKEPIYTELTDQILAATPQNQKRSFCVVI